jgi:hypothetical protein
MDWIDLEHFVSRRAHGPHGKGLRAGQNIETDIDRGCREQLRNGDGAGSGLVSGVSRKTSSLLETRFHSRCMQAMS